MSLRTQVALVIAALSLLPNLVMALMVLVTVYGQASAIPRSLWLPLGSWIGVVAVLSTGIGYLLSRQLLSPLLRLNHQITVLQSSPDRLIRIKLALDKNEPKETLALKRSFNDLLQQVNLEQSRRSSFMATLTHDLKTPLIAAGHLLTVIRDSDALTREERINLADQLLRENQSLIALVQKLVDAYKFERDGVSLTCRPHDLDALVNAVVERVRPLAEQQGVAIEVRGKARVSVDARELERALYNLLSNAVRYARQRIKVEIFSGVTRLSDDGPGLPAPLEVLAQPFNAQPVDIAGQRYTAGTGGLGLYIARRIIEAHGGRLVTEASGPQGTVFLIYLGQG